MILAERMRKRMEECDVSQSELARRVGVSQTTIAKLVSGRGYGSKHLHRIARVLATTPAYLDGEIDDPGEGAAPPPPAPAPRLFLQVELPTVEALAVMFEALLDGLDRDAPQSEQALLLAERLPIGLSQLVDARPAPLPKVRRSLAPDEAQSSEPMPDRGHRS